MNVTRLASLIATRTIQSVAVIRDGRYDVQQVVRATLEDGIVTITTQNGNIQDNITFPLADVTLFEYVTEITFNICVKGHREEYSLFC